MIKDLWHHDPRLAATVAVWKYVQGYSYSLIAHNLRQLNYDTTMNSVEHIIRNWGLSPQIEEFNRTELAYVDIASHLDKILHLPPIKKQKPVKTKSTQNKMTLVISDIHCPFENSAMIRDIISKYGYQGVDLVIGGDFPDQYSASRFIAYNLKVNIYEEFLKCKALMEIIAAAFNTVTLISDNHGQRLYKMLLQKLGKDYMHSDLINYDWYQYYEQTFDNVFVAHNELAPKHGSHVLTHYHIIGKDCSVSHFEFAGGRNAITKAAHDVSDWARSWRSIAPELAACKMFLQGHTHVLSKAFIEGGEIVLGETGCTCQVQEYAIAPNSKYQPGVNGYWEVFQTDGITDINKSNPIIWKG
jgi:hypothetical protein